MLIDVMIHPGSSQKKIVLKDQTYHVYIHSQPEKGKANRESMESLADYFKIPKKAVTIQKGQTSRKKIVEVELS